MATYIYLNTYQSEHGVKYLYIGSHTWNGPEGTLDTTYHGSSKIAQQYGWSPIKEEILEVVSEERKFIAEREWILKYASLYGIADCAARSNHNQAWLNLFPKHGSLINLHANNAEAAIPAAHTPEVLAKVAKTRVEQGINKRFAAAGNKKASLPEAREKAYQTLLSQGRVGEMIKGLYTEEALSKAQQSRKEHAAKDPTWGKPYQVTLTKEGKSVTGNVRQCLIALNDPQPNRTTIPICSRLRKGHTDFICKGYHVIKHSQEGCYQYVPVFTEEQHKLAAENHDYQASAQKMSETKKENGIKPIFNKYNVYSNGTLIAEGSAKHCCEQIGHPQWINWVCRKARNLQTFHREQFTFTL